MVICVPDPGSLTKHIGERVFSSETRVITQREVDNFVDLVGDDQWIHKNGAVPNGTGVIVPGNLLISLLPNLLACTYQVKRVERCLLAGYKEVRFREPVLVGSRVGIAATIRKVKVFRSMVRVETECDLVADASPTPRLSLIIVDAYVPASPLSPQSDNA